jgi:hypothetical protein
MSVAVLREVTDLRYKDGEPAYIYIRSTFDVHARSMRCLLTNRSQGYAQGPIRQQAANRQQHPGYGHFPRLLTPTSKFGSLSAFERPLCSLHSR